MARSVEEFRIESELSRAELAATVDRLKVQLSDTAEDIRHKISPQHIKSEVSDYISQKSQSRVEALKQQAMDNPMQAIAAGTAVAVPVLRLARAFPLPLLMIGAGLALTSKSVRGRAAEAAAPVMNRGREMLNQAAERAQELGANVKDTVTTTQSQATDLANDAQDKAEARTAEITSTLSDKLKDGMDAAKDTIERARSTAKDTVAAAKDTAATAPAKAQQLIGDNAALIGGLGIAIGAIIAAALPKADAEAKVMGEASDRVKQRATEATQAGFKAAKDAAMSAADAVSERVEAADLGTHASRMTANMSETLNEAAKDVVTAAFDPSRNQNS